MKRSIQLSSLAAAVALSAAALAPVTAMAGTSATVGVSNFYLFRGLNLSDNAAQLSGSIDYTHDSGAYAGVWVSNSTSGQEYDLYLGYATQIAGLDINANLTSYEYPAVVSNGDIQDTQKFGSSSEFILSLGYDLSGLGKVNASVARSLQRNDLYYTLGYGLGKFSATVGAQTFDQDGLNDYTHVDLGYALNDDVSLTITQIVSQDTKRSDGGSLNEDPTINLSWKKKFDL